MLVLETNAPGGQAGSSSKIENYLGFPTGISGQELAARAYTQAQKFGAQVMIAQSATRLTATASPTPSRSGDGARVPARTVIIATGAEYRKPPLENLSRFEGAGVYYAATFMEAQLCGGEEVIVVGGGNSAGQAAVFLAQTAKRVHMLVRSNGLAETMSRYLIRRIEENPAIVLRRARRSSALEGDGHLERVRWRDQRTGDTETHDIRHVFVMTGAVPNTAWLDGCVGARREGIHQDGSGPVAGGSGRGALAARPGPPSARDEPARRVRGRRRAGGQHQARGVRGRRGIDRGRLRPPGAPRVK